MNTEIKAIYGLLVDVYEGRKELEHVANYLYKQMGVPKGATRMYFNSFRAMKEDWLNTMNIRNDVLCYFLERIYADDGNDGLRVALNALSRRIKFCEEFLNEPRQENLRKIRDDFSMKLLVNSSPALIKCPNCSNIFQGNSLNGASPI